MMKRAILLACFLVAPFLGATDFHVTTGGGNTACSLGSPGSLDWAMQNGCNAQPGDNIWIHGGTYAAGSGVLFGFVGKGSAAAPVIFRNYQNQHAIIECGGTHTSGMCMGTHDSPNDLTIGSYVLFWGLDIRNTSTETRVSDTGIVSVTNGNANIVENSGQPFVAADMNGKAITIGGVGYTVNTVTDGTHLSLTATYSGTTGAAIAHWNGGDPTPLWMHEPLLSTPGSGFINCFFRNMVDGILTNSGNGGGKTIYGNFIQYAGYTGTQRGYGHSFYNKNPLAQGETWRSTWKHNIGLRSFQYGSQNYSTSDQLSYISQLSNAEVASGFGAYPNTTWTATGLWNTFYLGSVSVTPSTACPDQGGSDKTLWHEIFDDNTGYGASGMSIGGSKGSCFTQITNNDFLFPGGTVFCNGCTFAPLTMTGNTWLTAPSGTGGPAPLFTQANYPSNTFLTDYPTSGKKIKYRPNAYESGRGWVEVQNWDLSANVTVDLIQAGAYVGEQYKVFNFQDNNPWDSTPIATGTCAANPCNVSLPTTCTGSCVIPAPSGTQQDGVTPMSAPPDLGPRFVIFILYPDWGTATTPTPTSTATPTSTPSRTPTLTPTPTMTPSQTVTPTPTFTPAFTSTPTFTPSMTPTPTATPSALPPSFYPSNCTLVAPMTAVADPLSPNGFHIETSVSGQSNPASGGTATCTFNVSASGPKRIWLLAVSPSSSQDSFYVELDGEGVSTSTQIADLGEARACPDASNPNEYDIWWGAGYKWVTLKSRNKNCAGLTTPVGYERSDTVGITAGVSLSAGNHTMKFYGREVGGQVAAVIVTSDFGLDPNIGTSTGPTPTPTPGLCRKTIRCNGKIGTRWVPCNYSQYGNSPCPWR